jgi:hypothetical protein
MVLTCMGHWQGCASENTLVLHGTDVHGALAGQYDENTLVALDKLLAACAQRGLRLMLTLTNYWKDYGGMTIYARCATFPPAARAVRCQVRHLPTSCQSSAVPAVRHRDVAAGDHHPQSTGQQPAPWEAPSCALLLPGVTGSRHGRPPRAQSCCLV